MTSKNTGDAGSRLPGDSSTPASDVRRRTLARSGLRPRPNTPTVDDVAFEQCVDGLGGRVRDELDVDRRRPRPRPSATHVTTPSATPAGASCVVGTTQRATSSPVTPSIGDGLRERAADIDTDP